MAAAPVEPPKPAAPVINRNPRPISQPQPQYPREAARAGTAGQVVVRYTIGADGRVTDVQIVSSRPRGVFDGAVRTAVQRWRFEAPGEPVTRRARSISGCNRPEGFLRCIATPASQAGVVVLAGSGRDRELFAVVQPCRQQP